VSWLDNDKLAREMFATGHAFELVVAAFFRAHGLTVEVGEQSIRASVTDRENWRGEIDLLVSGVPVEVKSRDVARWFDPLNLCSRRAWESKRDRVGAWVMISQRTGEILVISGARARSCATVAATRDPGRGIQSYEVVRVPLDQFSPVSVAVPWFKSHPAT
jgi:hypothetical protein